MRGALRPLCLSFNELGIQCIGEPRYDFVLHVEQIGDGFVEALGPKVSAASTSYQSVARASHDGNPRRLSVDCLLLALWPMHPCESTITLFETPINISRQQALCLLAKDVQVLAS